MVAEDSFLFTFSVIFYFLLKVIDEILYYLQILHALVLKLGF